MTSEPKEYIAVLKALYDYEPSSEDELAIKEDQILFLVEKTDDEWWKVKQKPDSQDDQTAPAGLVPASYLEEAEPTSVVKALYDYEAAAPGELSIAEDETLAVYDKDDDWLLVKSERDGGRVGYVPGNYVREPTDEGKPVENDASHIVIPDSPPQRPISTYVDPADRVAATVDKAKADDIQTWAVSEVDKKGKKKKGTLGVGNGAIFFASESDKTPVQKWQTSSIDDIKVEKSKHVHLEIGGATPINLHFNVGSKDNADAIVKKLESSRALATGASASTPLDERTNSPPISPVPSPLSVAVPGAGQKPNKNGATVRFAASPAVIPSPDTPVDAEAEEEEDETTVEGEVGAALYDFVADGDDELSVKEGEQLIILDKVSSEEWWKCRNEHGAEGVVPSSYIEAVGSATTPAMEDDDNDDVEERERAAREEAEREEAARAAAAEAELAAAQARDRAEKDRKKQELDRKAKAAAAAAKAEKERRDQENREREERISQERVAAEKRLAEKRLADASKRTSHEGDGHRSSKSRTSTEAQPKFPNEGKTRIWHDHSGQWRTEAEFLGISKGKIRLHKINGVIIEVPPEKMSPDDVRFIESLTGKKLGAPSAPTPSSRPRVKDDDDVPLGALSQRRSLPDPSPTRPTPPPKKAPTIDWFEFFLNAGCDIDDCTRYSTSFERDKIDESILPDLKESTLRSLGLREGDIIRVSKVIEQRKAKSSGLDDNHIKAQLARDEELAKALQAEEDIGLSSRRANTTSPPNLFTGPGGALKTQQRRGRPQPRGTAPPVNVDVNSIASASDQISRTSSPLVASPSIPRATSPAGLNVPKRAPSTQPSGFDDDAWTNRPSSTKVTSTSPATTPGPPPATTPGPPPAPTPPPAPPASVSPAPAPPAPAPPAPAPPAAPVAPPQPPRPTSTSQPQPTQDSGNFDILAKIGQMRPPSAPAPQSSVLGRTSPVISPPPQSYHSGLGMGSSPVPLGQHLQNQQTGLYQAPQNGPRGPLAPVPSNQSLLNPLIPTTTGFNQFVPTRPGSSPPFQPIGQPAFQPLGQTSFPSSGQNSFQSNTPPSFLSTPPTGFGVTGPLMMHQTGFPGMAPQQTGMFSSVPAQPTGFGAGFGGPGNSNFMPPNGFNGGSMQPSFNNSFSQSSFGNGGLTPASTNTPQKDHSPASVFAQMKSGTFGDDSAPQTADKYDALRPQPTGWQNGFSSQGSYGSY